MPRPRISAGTSIPRARPSTTRSPIRMLPPLGSSSPAIIRKVVVLPQPEGPSSVSSSPSAAVSVAPSTATKAPKLLERLSSAMSGTGYSSASADAEHPLHVFKEEVGLIKLLIGDALHQLHAGEAHLGDRRLDVRVRDGSALIAP